jgi:hypothetical protein
MASSARVEGSGMDNAVVAPAAIKLWILVVA